MKESIVNLYESLESKKARDVVAEALALSSLLTPEVKAGQPSRRLSVVSDPPKSEVAKAMERADANLMKIYKDENRRVNLTLWLMVLCVGIGFSILAYAIWLVIARHEEFSWTKGVSGTLTVFISRWPGKICKDTRRELKPLQNAILRVAEFRAMVNKSTVDTGDLAVKALVDEKPTSSESPNPDLKKKNIGEGPLRNQSLIARAVEVQPMRILFLAANPTTTSRLDLEEELRSLEAELRGTKYRDQIVLMARHSVRPDDLVHYVRSYQPTVVHFSGHGSGGGIILRNDEGGYTEVTGTSLQRFFMNRGVQLIVLNACYTQAQAKLLRDAVLAVIGTTDSVGDIAARRFTVAFYRALGDGYSIREAFRDGGDAVILDNKDDVFWSDGELDEVLVAPAKS